jgi:hypothetical protein
MDQNFLIKPVLASERMTGDYSLSLTVKNADL